jgi:hypothetical protein
MDTITEASPPRINLHRMSRKSAKKPLPQCVFLQEIDLNASSDPSPPMDVDNLPPIRTSSPEPDSAAPSTPFSTGSKRSRETQLDDAESASKKVKTADLLVPPFSDMYVPGARSGGACASDYADPVPAVINRARHDYQTSILTKNPFPGGDDRRSFATPAWKKSQKIAEVSFKLTTRIVSIVCAPFIIDFSNFSS